MLKDRLQNKFKELAMAILLITYDSDKPGQDGEKILEFIRSSAAWAKLAESSYAINTEETPHAIFQKLMPFLCDSSRLFVVNLTRPYAGIKGNGVITWLDRCLPQ